MTAIDFGHLQTGAPGRRQEPGPGHAVEDLYWGYVIRNLEAPPLAFVAGQVLCWAAGSVAALSAFGIWLAPTSLIDDAVGLRMAASLLFSGLASVLLWFANRRMVSEIQIDTRMGEVREITRNRAGRAQIHARHGFDSVGGVFIDRVGQRGRLPRGHGVLVLRLGNTAQVVPVATGDELALKPLRDRLGRDLVVRPRQPVARLM